MRTRTKKQKPQNEQSSEVMHIYRIKQKPNEASPEISIDENMNGS